jgi:hypothetical protein
VADAGAWRMWPVLEHGEGGRLSMEEVVAAGR